ncbi:nicotinate-nucleotide--dimethylbenzimidazole phosphoribosyltransferase, partial [Cutibacterium acnes]
MELKRRIELEIEALDDRAMEKARERLASLTMPRGSLGDLGELAVRLCGITGEMPPSLERKAVIVMAGDHGVCEEGVSAYPSSVTEQMVMNFLNGGAAVNVFAKHAGADVVCVDMGVATDLSHPRLINRKVGYGTNNIARG